MRDLLLCVHVVVKTINYLLCVMSIFAHTHGITLLERRKLCFYHLDGAGLEPIVLPWKCHNGHIMELYEYNNCTKFLMKLLEVLKSILP